MHTYVDNNAELRDLRGKENHVKNLDPTISWEHSSPYCYDELKSEAFSSQTQAHKVLTEIKSLEYKENYSAYAVFESRSHKGMWRVIARLNLIKKK